ncbi:META domain-containing protein [Planktothrix sp. FACHB-1355]|uniref:META domain-containing protein n=1 Tax=Aerosakkonema funiforme FACHB-1375 TaxID=2949571 RepID=A0A926VC40_9CYAN|nr:MULTISPECIES: META domain-containing protein [Oscillatoriales]MBD2180810.1 META domain-containing protein [Aerosakkonema funiforme FACHB-1375]MBD3562101.1 META domain-containing protein [Planktothrix sp. FACHB-1355]
MIRKHQYKITLILLSACFLCLPIAYRSEGAKLAIAASNPTENSAVFNGKIMQRSLNGTSWTLVSWGTANARSSPLRNTRITAQFTNNTMSGLASCNNYNASYQTNGNNLTVNSPATTRKACSPDIMRQESEYLAALQSAQRYRITNNNQLQIFYRVNGSRGLMTFRQQ